MAQVEAIVEPDGVGNDIGRESVSLVCAHAAILPISVSLLGSTIPPPILPVPVSLLVSNRNRPLKRPILSESIPGSLHSSIGCDLANGDDQN